MSFDPKIPSSVIHLTSNDITKSFLYDTFAVRLGQTKPLLDYAEEFKLDLNALKEANSPCALFSNMKDLDGETTTVGEFITNLFYCDIPYDFDVLEDSADGGDVVVIGHEKGHLMSLLDYRNEAFTKKVTGNTDAKMSELLLDDKINTEVMEEYINRAQWFAYTMAVFCAPSLDIATINPNKKIIAYREKMFKENKKIIDENDVSAFAKIEKDILEFAKKELDAEETTGKLIYDSGYNGDFNNNYKVTSIMRGIAPRSDDTSAFSIMKSSLNEGVSKEDLPHHADLAVLGGAGRAKDTQLAGYKTKIFNAAFGSIIAGKYKSDCKSKSYFKVTLTKRDVKDYKYRNAVIDGKIVNLGNAENVQKYVGRTLELRSPLGCKSPAICNVCLGDMSYKLRIKNIGLHISRITTKLMGLSMKAFHNMAVDPTSVDVLDYMQAE